MTSFTEFLDTDKNYQMILNRHHQVHKEASSCNTAVMHEARKIVALLQAFDATVDMLGEHECITENDEADILLKKCTGSDSLDWFNTTQIALDLLKNQVVEQCQQVILAQHNYTKTKEIANKHCDSLTAARNEAQKRFKRSQSKTVKE
jgi:hypothetical protein